MKYTWVPVGVKYSTDEVGMKLQYLMGIGDRLGRYEMWGGGWVRTGK